MDNKYNRTPQVNQLELERKDNFHDFTNTSTTDEKVIEDTRSYESLEQTTKPNREVFTDTTVETYNNSGKVELRRKYQTLPDLWEDYIPEKLEDYENSVAVSQINETASFIKSIRQLARESGSEILSFNYTENEGTFFVTLTEGADSQKVSVIRMNPLDGPNSESIIGRNIQLDSKYDRQTHQLTSVVRCVDELGNETTITLQGHGSGNSVMVNGETKSIRYAGRLDTELEHRFPMTYEGRERKSQDIVNKRLGKSTSEHGLYL